MSRHVGVRPRRRLRAAIVLAIAAAGLLLGTDGSLALFTDSATVTTGTSSAGAVATPVAPTAAKAASPSTNVVVTWSATRVGPTDGLASAYQVVRYDAATGGTGTVVCSSTGSPGAPPPATCTDTTPPTAKAWYALRARVGDNWVREGARTPYDVDTTPPTVVITNVNTCSPQVACGTAADTGGGTVAKVEYSLRRSRTPPLSATTVTCWNGSGYVASTGGDCPMFYVATGTTSWSVPGDRATAYPARPAFGSQSWVLTVRATDSFGNVSTEVTSNFSN